MKARAASKSVPRNGAAVLVKRVTVGAGQSKTVTVKLLPKKARKAITVKTRKTGRVAVRTDSAPRARIRVTVRATGSGVTPAAFTRTWKVR